MRVKAVLASRIFDPEPAAASFRLKAVADALVERGSEVTVLTSRFENAAPHSTIDNPFVPIERRKVGNEGRVLRWPVLRDKTGYLRGYVPYMSFDIPLFFRVLTAGRTDVVLVEPPPTTGFFIRLASGIRRIPYVWYAADVWSDATEIAGASAPVVTLVRALERFTLKGAAGVIAVSEGVAERVRALGGQNVRVIPNGIDTDVYHPDVEPLSTTELGELGIIGPYLLYAGTASEWQEAEVFAEAMSHLANDDTELQAVFVGQGTHWGNIKKAADRLRNEFGRDVVIQLPPATPQRVARLLRGAELALVSIVPEAGYDFAYPTKVLAALASGTPVLYAGTGPVTDEILANDLGFISKHEPRAIAETLEAALEPVSKSRINPKRLHEWVVNNRSLKATGTRAAQFIRSCAKF